MSTITFHHIVFQSGAQRQTGGSKRGQDLQEDMWMYLQESKGDGGGEMMQRSWNRQQDGHWQIPIASSR